MSAVTARFSPRVLAVAAVWSAAFVVLAAGPASAQAQDNVKGGGSATSLRLTSPSGGLWLRGRGVGATTLAESANLGTSGDPSWRLLGSYDLPKANGLRATGGMIGVTRRTALGAASLQDSQRWDNGLTRGWIEGTRVPDTASQANHISVPYAGLSYTTSNTFAGARGLASSAWSFNIDLGVMALAPRSSVRFGSADIQQSRLDDMLRELRLSPLLQLGVSYSF